MEEFVASFNAVDTDHDGYIDNNELTDLMKKYEPEYYLGFASTIIDRVDFQGAQGGKINLDQAKEYFASHQNKIDYLFEMKYELLKEVLFGRNQVEELKKQPEEPEQQDGAPPAAEPTESPEAKPHNSNIRIKIGNEAEMRNRLEVHLKKSDVACQQNFVRLSIRVSAPEKAQQLVASINAFYASVKEILISELPQSQYIVDRLEFVVKNEGAQVTVSLRSKCHELNEIIELMVGFLDRITESLTEIEMDLKVMSGISLKTFLEGTDSLYSLFIKDILVELRTRANKQTIEALRKLGVVVEVEKCADYFKGMEFLRPEQLLLYLMHTQQLETTIEMDNTTELPLTEQLTAEQAEMKLAFVGAPAQLLAELKLHYPFAGTFLQQLYNQADSSIEVTANISRLSVQAKLQLVEVGNFYKKVCEVEVEVDPVPDEDD